MDVVVTCCQTCVCCSCSRHGSGSKSRSRSSVDSASRQASRAVISSRHAPGAAGTSQYHACNAAAAGGPNAWLAGPGSATKIAQTAEQVWNLAGQLRVSRVNLSIAGVDRPIATGAYCLRLLFLS